MGEKSNRERRLWPQHRNGVDARKTSSACVRWAPAHFFDSISRVPVWSPFELSELRKCVETVEGSGLCLSNRVKTARWFSPKLEKRWLNFRFALNQMAVIRMDSVRGNMCRLPGVLLFCALYLTATVLANPRSCDSVKSVLESKGFAGQGILDKPQNGKLFLLSMHLFGVRPLLHLFHEMSQPKPRNMRFFAIFPPTPTKCNEQLSLYLGLSCVHQNYINKSILTYILIVQINCLF